MGPNPKGRKTRSVTLNLRSRVGYLRVVECCENPGCSVTLLLRTPRRKCVTARVRVVGRQVGGGKCFGAQWTENYEVPESTITRPPKGGRRFVTKLSSSRISLSAGRRTAIMAGMPSDLDCSSCGSRKQAVVYAAPSAGNSAVLLCPRCDLLALWPRSTR